MNATGRRPKVVIIGAGFGGLQAAKKFEEEEVDVTVLDRTNHHLFQPLLYQVATAGLSPGEIASPVRHVLRGQANIEVQLAEVTGVDTNRHEVQTSIGSLPFDYLIIATGARHSYFGHDEWEEHAPGLKSISDATRLRKNILLAFEEAERPMSDRERRALLTFVIVGAGPTGVEMAGSIAELATRSMKKNFQHFDPSMARIILVEAGPRILATFPEKLSKAAAKELEHMKVEVHTGKAVTHIDNEGVMIGDERIEARTIMWAAGVKASPAGEWLHVETDRSGRVVVDEFLHPGGMKNIYVIGDTAAAKDNKGNLLPGVATVAMQQGRYVAADILKRINQENGKPFSYFDKGSLATVGRRFAVAKLGNSTFSGFPAWILWIAVHIMYLIGFRNRILVLLQWAAAYITYQRGVRLIVTEEEREPAAETSAEASASQSKQLQRIEGSVSFATRPGVRDSVTANQHVTAETVTPPDGEVVRKEQRN